MSNTARTREVEVQLHYRYGHEDGKRGDWTPVHPDTPKAAADAYREGFEDAQGGSDWTPGPSMVGMCGF